jgi:hypothetical protein
MRGSTTLFAIVCQNCSAEVIVPLREKAEEKDMLFEMILEDTGSEQKTSEIAILGEPSAQGLAEVKVRSIVEKHHPGFAEKEPWHTRFFRVCIQD